MIESGNRLSIQRGINRAYYQSLIFDIMVLILILSLAKFPLSLHIPVWETKPLLGYLILTESISNDLENSQILTVEQMNYVQTISWSEFQQLKALEKSSSYIVNNPNLTIADKQFLIKKLGYNRHLYQIIRKSRRKLREGLGFAAYWKFVGWSESRWIREQTIHGSVQKGTGPRTYKIYATRYDAGDRYSVALPDKCLKFANGGLHICDDKGYTTKKNYYVYLSYKKHTSALVAESGPWNVDDNYWANFNDPTPRRMFADLQLGMPEAQAAYFNGYNGGVDQFGRVVTAPYGVDLARKVSIDIGLKPGQNDWINISYLWTEGWDQKSSGNSTDEKSGAVVIPSEEVISPIKLATPNSEGIIVHKVEAGQSLWNIAAAYNVELAELLAINNLTKNSLIYPGEELIIKRAVITKEPSPEVNTTVSRTEIPTKIIESKTSESNVKVQNTITPINNSTQTNHGTNLDEKKRSFMTILNSGNLLIGILIVTILGILLLISGLILERRNY